VLTLPTYAATAWYHHKLPNQPATLEPLLAEVFTTHLLMRNSRVEEDLVLIWMNHSHS
jgi:hypothetical protein